MEFILKLDPETENKINQLFQWIESQKEVIPAPDRETQPQYLYSIKEFADFLGCSPTTAQKIKNSGKVRFRQSGRKVVFVASEVLEDLKRKR